MSGNAMTITVLMPAYNAARFLPQAIGSVLDQTYDDFEFIIIDDGSTDETPLILRSYANQDKRIEIITHPNMGMGKSLNEAMKEAKGNWIARIDADDIMMPQRLERQIIFLNENPHLAVASSLVYYINEKGRTIGKYSSHFTSRAAITEAQQKDEPIGFHHPAAIFRKDIIQSVGGYRPEFWPADDMDLWNRVADAGHEVLVQPELLTKYRIHSSSVTVGQFRTTEEKAHWVEACIKARHTNQPEPTWEEFRALRHRQSWLQQFNAFRQDYGRALYKSAVCHFSHRRYERFLPRLMAAAALEPWYVLQRVLPQLRRS